jgi:azurin
MPATSPVFQGENNGKAMEALPLALAMTAVAAPVLAADCAVEIEGNDAMQFNKPTISVPASCKQFTVKLKHVGKLPKTAMGQLGAEQDGRPAGRGQ